MREYPINYSDLHVEMPIEVKAIQKLKITEEINEHAEAKLTFIIESDKKHKIVDEFNFTTNIVIKHNTDGVLFSGIPVLVKCTHVGEEYEVELTLKNYTYVMDIEIKSRSFQDKNNLYENIFNEVVNIGYKGAALQLILNEKKQGKAIIQYKETDWQFIKRIASQLDAVVVTDVAYKTTRIFIGVPAGTNYSHNLVNHTLKNDTEDYLKAKYKRKEWMPENSITYEISSIDNFQIGNKITYNEIALTIIKKEVVLIQGIIVFSYILKNEKGIKQDLITNPLFTGPSLNGKVIEVSKDYGNRLKISQHKNMCNKFIISKLV